MSIMFVSTTDFPSGQIIEFNIDAIKDSRNVDIKAIYDLFVFQEDLNTGKVYHQAGTDNLWYIDSGDKFARIISNEQLELIRQWSKKPLLPSELQLNLLIKIGGLPSSVYSLEPDYLRFPAKVITKENKEIDLCLFHFSKSPPFQRYFKKVIFLDDIKEIRPSEYALQHQLRLSSMLADEYRMGFSPFMVKTKSDEIITYNGITQFASNGNINGFEIEREVEFSYENFKKVDGVSFDEITFIIGKWNSQIENLFINYRSLLEKKSPPLILSKPKKQWWKRLFDFF